jgi:hypothetical protein
MDLQCNMLERKKYSFAVKVVEPWNRLPDTLKKQQQGSFQEGVEAAEKIELKRMDSMNGKCL